jgi:hypothetical protein
MSHAGRPIRHSRLLAAVWGSGYGLKPEYLRTYVCQLRKKLEDDSESAIPANPFALRPLFLRIDRPRYDLGKTGMLGLFAPVLVRVRPRHSILNIPRYAPLAFGDLSRNGEIAIFAIFTKSAGTFPPFLICRLNLLRVARLLHL